jgi:hypothetical protein
MMKATQPRTGDQRRRQTKLAFHWPPIRRILFEGIVNPVIVIVVDIIANKPAEMLFVECDDMIENLAAAASHPAFRNPILPGCLHTCAFRLKTRYLQEGHHIGIEFRVVVEDGITMRNRVGKSFPQLLNNPISGRMTSNIEMQNPAAAMLDDEEAI